MKKQLTNPTLANELREGSSFFRRPEPDVATPKPSAPAAQEPTANPAPSPTHARRPDIGTERHHDIKMSRYQDSMIEEIRKAVRVVGREPGTIRLTEQEKLALTDVVYTLGRQGNRTSENELYRVAVNFLLADWREHGQESVLARVLAALHA